MKKRILYITLVTLVLLVAPLALLWHRAKRPTQVIHKDFTQHISAYTSGTISSRSRITVRLRQKPDVELDDAITGSLFSCSPAIQGTTTWDDAYTVVFKPDAPLPGGKRFDVKFHLGKLKEVEEHLKTFQFRLETIEQALQVDIEGLQVYNIQDPTVMQLKGTLTTADFTPDKKVEDVLRASQQGKPLSISWTHQASTKTHTFLVEGIQRTDNPNDKVLLEWRGRPIASRSNGQKEITIPPLGSFAATDAYLSAQSKSCVAVYFSDPVDSTQDLTGLIQLEDGSTGAHTRVRLKVDNNIVYVYARKSAKKSYKLTVAEGIRNTLGDTLSKRFEKTILIESIKPEVQLVGEGVILPSSQGLIFPFKAVSLSGVIVRVVKIPADSSFQFLQVNRYDQDKQLRRVGRLVYKKRIPLNKDVDLTQWNTFSLDLSDLIAVEPGAFYRVYVSFDRNQALYPCTCTDHQDDIATSNQLEEARELRHFDAPDGASDDYYNYDCASSWYYEHDDETFNWRERNDPCKPSYYMYGRQTIQRNMIASDLGIIAKRNDNKELLVTISDLRTTDPIGYVKLQVYNYQHQLVGSGSTSSTGMVHLQLSGEPFLLVAKKGKQVGYLHLNESNACSLSMFDVDGHKTKKGLKGLIYGERGVWRPGDTMYLSFILEDKRHTLPAKHPVIFELYTPQNQLHTREVVKEGLNGFYTFAPTTEADDPTGNWMAKVKVGGTTFTKTIRIETIKPNRLKATLTFDQAALAKGNFKGILVSQWLHGAVAKGLKADVNVRLSPTKTTFPDYPNYIFDDPRKELASSEKAIFEGILDQEGKATFATSAGLGDTPPGMVKANFNIRVFEQGGNFSVDRTSINYSPYYSYVGFQLPKGEGYNDALLSNQNNLIPIVTVDEDGNPVARKKVKVEVYELGWRWWFDRSDENDIAKYVYSNSTHCIHTGYVDTPNGKAIYNLNLGIRTWGRKYIRITDPVTDHSAGQVFYTDYTGYWQDVKKQASGAEMLTFRTNKRKYQVGERVEVDLPATKIGRALVSIESGSKILDTFWVPINADNHSFHFKATPEMAPNVYVHVTYIQPHNQRDNDLPMRLYGIQPITVEDPETHLQPVISMPSVLVPEQEVTIKVREQQGKKMTYTIAMVDEGLLGITGFKTPAPWRHFYAREALGIKTWDMYPYVAGAYTGAMSGLRAVGGDEELFTSNIAGEKANRFEPVVHHIGPVALAPGRENTHTIKMPNYVGAVKTMVIAGQAGAYGSCTQTTPVKKPLMVVATLPRVVGPQEAVKMPVTVFAMDDAIREATVTITPNAFFDVVGPKKKKVYFSSTGDKLVTFDLVVRKKIGVGKVKVTTQSGTEKATYAIELDVRLPNPRMTQTIDAVLEPGQTWETTYEPVGLPGTNNGTLEIAGIPPINLASRLQYLMQYPHGCVEQTTSAVFPQLYLSSLLDLTPQQRQQIQSNVMAGLQRLKSFQTNTGGFSYWPGEHYSPSKWGTNYAGHFMLEAQAAGYTLPVGLLDGWIKYQTTQANQWTVSASKYAYYRHSHQRIQAYRLYTLALADKPALGAMNRFRTSGNLSVTAQWLLAAAYHLAGKPEVAQELVDGLATYVKPYRELSYSYGSDTRDRAIILSALCLLQKRAEAKDIADSLAKTLSSDAWLGTQTTAYSLLAMAQFVGGTHATRGVQCTYQLQQGAATPLSTTAPITQVPLPIKAANPGHVAVTNTSTSTLFVKVQLDGIPLETTGPEQQNDLQMSIQYLDMAGQRINPSKLEQGKDFVAEVRVHHPGTRSDYKDMALVHHFPAGWEIKNDRLDQEEAKAQDTPTYQDIRDDRVYSYFDLKQHETKTFRVVLNATYIGRYYLPAVYCEAMYDASIHAQRNGQWVEVGE